MAANMEDIASGEEDDFQAVKKIKMGSIFENYSHSQRIRNTKVKRGRSLSLKSTRTKKNASRNTTIFERRPQDVTLDDKNQLMFCPVCQLPVHLLIGLSLDGHVQACVASFSESLVPCPNGIDCKSMVPEHFKQFSHQQLASLRSSTIPKCPQVASSPSAEATSTKHDIHSCVKECSQNAINTGEDTFPIDRCEMDTESSIKSHTQSSEKENLDEVINQWLNDDSIDYESSGNNSVPTKQESANMSNATKHFTSTETSPAASSNTVFTNSNMSNTGTTVTGLGPSAEKVVSNRISTQSKSPRTTKLDTRCKKQMDIGIYFGLKPKQKVTENKTEGASNNVCDVLQPTNKQFIGGGKSTLQNKKCPFYKIVEGTSFAVDAFSYGHVPGISAYFLSHFHYDHYGGLKRSFSKPIYCSQVTANLISLKIKVAAKYIHPLSMNAPTMIENIEVTLLEANHCPGAVMFIFRLPNGVTHLHTGDFRASTAMQEISTLKQASIHTLYLDTTYCDPHYSFPPQSETIEFCASVAAKAIKRNAKTLIVVGTYTIGKEKIFTAVANILQCNVAVQREKYNVLKCLESDQLKKIIVQDYKNAEIHVLPMAHLTHEKLINHLKSNSAKYTELLALKPTGWTFTGNRNQGGELKSIKPSKRGQVTIYGVPYSEHSSFSELKEFVQFIKPQKIIPTVNNGSAKRREEMTAFFKSWLKN
ncbi:DNA cross-link repair 1A protein-like [Dendronephthya gigantea]|uniref:DNA cross-link repair 1A protein-like n=1 Tax=Dendronephthya gigantea TaxID=151771 RepID=UPI00106A8208|nr:DNA cross-link repair 1A protein-like [Dendronephthya gigantea]